MVYLSLQILYLILISFYSFHVGTECEESRAYTDAIQQAREAFDMGTELGFNMKILDIGGGYPGNTSSEPLFKQIAGAVNEALAKYFPEEGISVIAEPGTFFVKSAFTLAVNVIGRRIKTTDAEDEKTALYYVNDGLYGSFDVMVKKQQEDVHVVNENTCAKIMKSTIWGPTCDSLDCVMKTVLLPKLDIGDWLYFTNMGAYTFSTASAFNGTYRTTGYYCCRKEDWDAVYKSSDNKNEEE